MEVVFNAVVTTRLVQKEKRWKDAVVTVGSGVLRVVDEQGKLLLKGAFRGEPEEDQEVRVGKRNFRAFKEFHTQGHDIYRGNVCE